MAAAVDQLTVQEKLLLAQAVYKVGAADWPTVSKLLSEHPCHIGRPPELFSPEACEASYVALMTGIEINVPAPDGARPQGESGWGRGGWGGDPAVDAPRGLE
jgi:bromodomain-containing protein 8